MADRNPLITADDLATRRDDPGLRIADTRWYLGERTRGRREFVASHIPGAVYVDLEQHLSASLGPGRHPLPDRETFAVTLGALGIGDEHEVVAYDDRGGAIAARMWWMLRDLGHRRVRVLDGGLPAWIAAGHPTTSEPYLPPAATTTIRPSSTRTIDRDSLAARLGEVTLLDAREGERYRGEAEPVDPIAGHIPTARSAPLEENLDADERFLSPAVLADRYLALGAADGEVVAYCGSGVTACHDILAMHLAGLPEPALYPGSWSDWCVSGLPIATGPDPGMA